MGASRYAKLLRETDNPEELGIIIHDMSDEELRRLMGRTLALYDNMETELRIRKESEVSVIQPHQL